MKSETKSSDAKKIFEKTKEKENEIPPLNITLKPIIPTMQTYQTVVAPKKSTLTLEEDLDRELHEEIAQIRPLREPQLDGPAQID